jgi:hypothetical protein
MPLHLYIPPDGAVQPKNYENHLVWLGPVWRGQIGLLPFKERVQAGKGWAESRSPSPLEFRGVERTAGRAVRLLPAMPVPARAV